ncbi:MAG: OmpH family outer membrane protein [Bacteroidota bacterium]
MKNISIILNVVLIVAVTLLYIDRFSGNDNDKEHKTGKSELSDAGLEIVYVNIDTLLNGYDYYNDLKTELIKEQKKLETNLNSKGKSLERKAMEFQQKVEKRLVTNNQAQEMQNQLMREQQNLMQLKEQLSMQLLEKEQQMNKQIFEKINKQLDEYNKEGNHKLILSNTYGGNILLADNNMNITESIMAKLNENYQTEQETVSEEKEDK